MGMQVVLLECDLLSPEIDVAPVAAAQFLHRKVKQMCWEPARVLHLECRMSGIGHGRWFFWCLIELDAWLNNRHWGSVVLRFYRAKTDGGGKRDTGRRDGEL